MSEKGGKFEPYCPACGGLGYQRIDVDPGHPAFGQLMLCEVCGNERRLKWLRQLSRLSNEMLGWRLDQFDTRNGVLERALGIIRGATMAWRGWITLSGPHGTGKSYLLAAIANEARLAGVPAVYITVAELLADLRDSFHPEAGQGFSSLLESIMRAEVLCLDEIEKFNTTPWAEEQFFRLIDHRYRHWQEGLTVLATNKPLTPTGIVENTRYPGYLESRIEDGRFVRLTEFWKVADWRPTLAQKEVQS